MKGDRNFQEVDRDCPKCGNTRAQGPEYRRGVGSDADLGEHLRFYCTACRYMTYQPTKDQDTPQRRQELSASFQRREREWKGVHEVPSRSPRRSQGWK